MEIGLLEIVTTVFIILAVLVIMRIVRVKPDDTVRGRESPSTVSRRAADRPAGLRSYLKRLGLAFVVAGLLLALTGMSLLRWAVRSYTWAFVALVVGFAVLYLSRKK